MECLGSSTFYLRRRHKKKKKKNNKIAAWPTTRECGIWLRVVTSGHMTKMAVKMAVTPFYLPYLYRNLMYTQTSSVYVL